jgi:hypothetical protein
LSTVATIESMLVDFLRQSLCMKTALSPQLYKNFFAEDKSEFLVESDGTRSASMMAGAQQTV